MQYPSIIVRLFPGVLGMYLATKLTVDFEAHAYSLANVDKGQEERVAW